MTPRARVRSGLRRGLGTLVAALLTLTAAVLVPLGSGAASAAMPHGEIVTLTPYVQPGAPVRWQASGLPKRTRLLLMWETVSGRWLVEGSKLLGDRYRFGREEIGSVVTSAEGTASGSFPAPAGFGGPHPFGLALPSGKVEAVGSVIVVMSASIDRTVAPEGSFFTIHVEGLGDGQYMGEYGVLYDNHYMGIVSAVSTAGSATFRVRAEGVGRHVISLLDSPVEGPYLNLQQSPYAFFTQYWFPVTVTPGTPTTIADPEPKVTLPEGHDLTVTPTAGVVGSRLTLAGRGLPANTRLTVVWQTMVGNRVTKTGFKPSLRYLGSVRTDAAGRFTWSLTVPNDLGGPPHRIMVLDGTRTVATGAFRILPALVGVYPNPVPEGYAFTIHLTGVGWTQYDNIYGVDYDNAYVGYACGFNSHGDVQIVLRAAGAPGYHFVDIYPALYKGATDFPNWYGMPQLTYAADHPGDALPAFHVVIDVVR